MKMVVNMCKDCIKYRERLAERKAEVTRLNNRIRKYKNEVIVKNVYNRKLKTYSSSARTKMNKMGKRFSLLKGFRKSFKSFFDILCEVLQEKNGMMTSKEEVREQLEKLPVWKDYLKTKGI